MVAKARVSDIDVLRNLSRGALLLATELEELSPRVRTLMHCHFLPA
jgi:hypothetical protein